MCDIHMCIHVNIAARRPPQNPGSPLEKCTWRRSERVTGTHGIESSRVKVPELGAHDVNITVIGWVGRVRHRVAVSNPPYDVHDFQGELGHLLHCLGDAGTGLVLYTQKNERHLTVLRRCVWHWLIIVDQSVCNTW